MIGICNPTASPPNFTDYKYTKKKMKISSFYYCNFFADLAENSVCNRLTHFEYSIFLAQVFRYRDCKLRIFA